MLALKIGRAPEWIDLVAGVRLHVAPVTSAVMLAVKSDLAAQFPLQMDEAGAPVVADLSGMQAALVKAIGRHVILGWEGVGDAEGEPVAVSPAAVDALMDLHRIFDAFEEQVVTPYLLVQSEKNASAPSLNGTSAAAETTAVPAMASAPSAPVS